MGDGDVGIEAGEGGGGGGGGVALDNDEVGAFFEYSFGGSGERFGEDFGRVLCFSHDLQVVIGGQVKPAKDLLEHFIMLGGGADGRGKIVRSGVEGGD